MGWAVVSAGTCFHGEIRFLWNALEMDVPAPHGASDTYGQLSDTEADTIRALRCGFTRLSFSVKRR